MLVHSLFDVLAWLSGGALAWWLHRRHLFGAAPLPTLAGVPGYFVALSLGAVSGALAFGSLNLGLAGRSPLGHSIAGALAGGIAAVELYKLARGMHGSTGLAFVAPLALGIAVGRLGCFFAGLPDYTYGIPTQVPWGVNFGDGVARHPVQVYETLAMLTFLCVFLRAAALRSEMVLRHGFYLFVAWYAAQRFLWEFLKPYPAILGQLNLFHLIAIALLVYSIIMMVRNHDVLARG